MRTTPKSLFSDSISRIVVYLLSSNAQMLEFSVRDNDRLGITITAAVMHWHIQLSSQLLEKNATYMSVMSVAAQWEKDVKLPIAGHKM